MTMAAVSAAVAAGGGQQKDVGAFDTGSHTTMLLLFKEDLSLLDNDIFRGLNRAANFASTH